MTYPLNHRGNKLEQFLALFTVVLLGYIPITHLPPSYQSTFLTFPLVLLLSVLKVKPAYTSWRGRLELTPHNTTAKKLVPFSNISLFEIPPPHSPKGEGTKFCVMWSRGLLECSQIYIKAEGFYFMCYGPSGSGCPCPTHRYINYGTFKTNSAELGFLPAS